MRFPNLSLFSKKPEDDSEYAYASFTARSAALVVDMLLLLLLLTPLYEYISQLMHPEFYRSGGMSQVQAVMEAVIRKEILVDEAMPQLEQLGLFQKMASDYTLQILLSAVIIIFAWVKYDTTPGMFLFRMHVADANTGEKPSLTQYITRYFVGLLAIAPLTLGMFIMFFNQRKMALHDYAAQTVVLHRKFRFKKKDTSQEETLGE